MKKRFIAQLLYLASSCFLLRMLLHTVIAPDTTPPIDLGYPSLSQQEMMELFVANLKTQYFRDSHGNFLDKCTWRGTGCSDAGDVTIISWERSTLNPPRTKNIGFVDFRWIPPTVELLELFSVSFCFFSAAHLPTAARAVELNIKTLPKGFGDLITADLPRDLSTLLVGGQRLEGSVHFETLPKSMKSLGIERNDFSGEVNLTKLPQGLIRCTMHNNQFAGPVDLNHLPPSLVLLTLHFNSFSGQIYIKGTSNKICDRSLRHERFLTPEAGMHLYFHGNGFDGALRYSGTAPGGIYARENRFTSIAWSSMDVIQTLDASCNRLQGSLRISEIPSSVEQIDLSENTLSGTIDFERMPVGVKRFNVSHNSLTGTVRFGEYSPENIFMNDNSFTALQIGRMQCIGKICRLDLSNNAIVQETAHLGVFDRSTQLRYINLQGNYITRCLYKGEVTSMKYLFYDNGTPTQRGKVCK